MDIHYHSIEPDLSTPKEGNVSVVAELLVYNPGCHVCRSRAHRQIFVTDCPLEHGHQWHTLLEVKCEVISGKRWILNQSDSIVFSQPQQEFQGLKCVVETCAGIGAVGRGFHFCQANTQCYNECNPEFHRWLKHNRNEPSILGNLTDAATVKAVHDTVDGPHILSSGMSCQPFSRLGDQRQQSDPRSDSFPGTLAMGYYLGSLAIILECTKEAKTSEWVQTTLQRFSKETGYTVSQTELSLHHSWVAKRDRWWAVIAHPALSFQGIPDMPEMRFDPTIMHVMPSVMQLPADQEQDLQLDETELQGFLGVKGGITSKIINMCKCLPTATHSWGSQLRACECKCRDKGFHPLRIEEKGLHGVLVPLQTSCTIKGHKQTNMRHMHPQEVALCCGLQPSHVCPSNSTSLRLDLAGVGQLATPLQGGWVLSNVIFQAANQGLIHEAKHPRLIFQEMCEALLSERDELWEGHQTKYTKILAQEVRAFAHPIVYIPPENLEVYSPCTDVVIGTVVQSFSEETAPGSMTPDSHEPSFSGPDEVRAATPVPPGLMVPVEPTELDVPHPPMIPADVHAEPTVECPLTAGPSHVTYHEQVQVRVEIQDDDETPCLPQGESLKPHLPMTDPVHAEPTVPYTEGPTQDIMNIVPGPPRTTDENAEPVQATSMTTGPSHDATLSGEDSLTSGGSELDSLDIQIAQQLQDQPLEPNELELFEATGAIPGFAAKRPASAIATEMPETKRPKTELNSPDHAAVTPVQDNHNDEIQVISDEFHIATATVPFGTTGQQIIQAESSLQHKTFKTMYNLVGEPIHVHASLVHDTHVILSTEARCPGECPPKLQAGTREALLWKQHGWVALDEMEYYMNFIESSLPSSTFPMFVMQNNPEDHIRLAQHITKMITTMARDLNTECMCSVVLFRQHWIPIVVKSQGDSAQVWIPRDATWIHECFNDHVGEHEIQFHSSVMPSVFAHDCGFQAIGWILSVTMQDDTSKPVDPMTASRWRSLFHAHLQTHQQLTQWVHKPLLLGGMNAQTQLAALVQDHGVHPERAQECAQQLMHQLGPAAVNQVLKSPRPWADLKSKANLASPPIKIVQADELQKMIQARAKTAKPIGSKANKLHNKGQTKPPIQLQADQLQIPRAVFKQDDGTELCQLQPQQLGPQCQGIVLTNIESAIPYFALTSPLSQQGVGMLVLETQDPRLPPQHTVIKVPVIHAKTQEPLIISAALFQLGHRQVSRLFPAQCIQVPQVETKAVRIQVYRDQTTCSWPDFVKGPFKAIMQQSPMADLATTDVLDVWDRQFVNTKLVKQSPENASIFLVNVRVTARAASEIMSHSGELGQYFEPRSEDGRHPDEQYQVIWMVQKQYAEAQLTHRAHANTVLVRQGDRYGLRVAIAEAENLHGVLRPDLVFLPGSELKKFKVGPWPFGSTKQSLMHVFKKWDWTARPINPVGQAQDRSGVMWSVQAAADPSHWIFHLQHGDVLIAPEDKQTAQVAVRPALLASPHTIKQLQQTDKPASDDPWLHQDPWKPSHQPQISKELSVGQFNALQEQLQEKLLAKLSPEDADMKEAVDSRVSVLESKLEQLTATVGQQHFEQQAQNKHIHAQLTQMDHKIDHQNQSLQTMLDAKLDQQLQRIEQMFHKRKGVGEWLGPTPVRKRGLYQSILWLICIFTCVCRIGEAANPGPTAQAPQVLQIGCINPTGLLGKSHLVASLPKPGPTIWAVSESHLTSPGMSKFRNELGFHKTGYHMHMGSPVPPRSQTISTVGGKQRGVGFLSTVQGRAMTQTWPTDEWMDNRFHLACFQIGQRWIQGGVIYGLAPQPHSQATKDYTDRQCQHVTERLVRQSSGLRFIAGDFNQEDGAINSMHQWADAGWINAQQWAAQHLGKEIQPTCKQNSTKDHIFLSPELAQYLRDVLVEDNTFADHAVVRAIFHDIERPPKLPLWRRPKPIDWHQVSQAQTAAHYTSPARTQDPTADYRAVWQAVEAAHQQAAAHKQLPQPAASYGRANTLEVHWRQEYSSPPKKGRQGEHQPAYHGIHMQHAQWTKQYRRLVNWERLCNQETNKPSAITHRQGLWESILQAAGFLPSFTQWWNHQPNTPCHMTQDEPMSQAAPIAAFFHSHLQAFEKNLNAARRQQARQRRQDNPQVIFNDLRKDPPQPVQMLVNNPASTIVAIDPVDQAVTVDPPQTWIPDQPARSKTIQKPIVFAENDTLWLDNVEDLQVGDTIQQEQYIGGVTELFQCFGEEWSKRWDKHRDTPITRWDPILDFAEAVLPRVAPMPYTPIDPATWKSTIKKKSKRAATGPDGVSRADLLNIPEQATEDILSIVTQVEQGRHWPQQLTTGFVISLEKVPGATRTGQFRPITLLPVPYRMWGSIRAKALLRHLSQFAPATCTGNLPGRQASQVWYNILCEIETSQLEQGTMTGAVLDLIKAFNLIPRIPVFKILQVLGISPEVATAWSQALIQLERRFQIQQCVGPAQRSCTGFPEGCALSVVSMLAINLVGHAYIKLRFPSVTLWTYVDNLELTGEDASEVSRAVQGLTSFTRLLDVAIDEAKTYTWSVSAAERQTLRAEALPTKLQARDLGGHMTYSMCNSNATITQRCQQADPLWNRLARSTAPYDQKTKAVRAKAWPAFLHGIASVHLADNHFDRLRTGAVRALGEHSAGVAPMAHLSLIEPVATDPQYCAIWSTLTMCRQMEVSSDHMHFCMSELQWPTKRVMPRPGPMSVLLTRLHQLSWHWHHGSFFLDHHGCPIDVLGCPVQELRQRTGQAWQMRVQSTLAARKTLQGLQWASPALTLKNWHKYEPEDRAILRTCLNGTFFTADRPVSQAQEDDSSCKFCGKPDSQIHRHWECQHFTAQRDMPAEQIATLLGFPPSVTAHGWMPEPPSLVQFRKLCLLIPDMHQHFQWPQHISPIIDCFTDGSCRNPTSPESRLAAWGVVLGLEDGSYWPLASGLVPGWLQTAIRGEIWAAISACTFGIVTNTSVRLWVDNSTVCRRLQAFLCDDSKPIGPNQRDADLWNHLRTLTIRLGKGRLSVVHVHSHQNLDNFDDFAEEWISQGNHHADNLADQVASQYPAIDTLWHQFQTDLQHVDLLRTRVHSTMLRIGKAAIHSNSTAPRPDKQYTNRLPSDLLETEFQPAQATDLPDKYQCDRTQPILDWVASLYDSTATPKFVAWFQLNALYEYTTGDKGIRHTLPSRQWVPGILDTKHVNFVQRTRSMSSYLLNTMDHLDIPCRAYHVRPDSHVIQFWTQCLYLRLSDEKLRQADEILGSSQKTFKTVQSLRCL